MLTGVLLIAAPLLPFIGATINGATLWLRVGSLSVQPAEFAKVALILGFAGFLATRQTQLTWIQHSVMGIGFPRPKDILKRCAASLHHNWKNWLVDYWGNAFSNWVHIRNLAIRSRSPKV
jgi:hypothetical protein